MSSTEDNEYPEFVNIHDILNCISQLEGVVSSIPRLLWKRPQDFYTFLTVELQNQLNPPSSSNQTSIDLTSDPSPLLQLHPIFQNGTDKYLPIHSIMKEVFEKAWKHDTPWTTLEELISAVSWTEFLNQSSAVELCSTSFQLDQMLTSLELLKTTRLKEIQTTMNKELKRKQSTGLQNFVKKSKTEAAIEASRDPSSSLTSTSARIMNTCKY